MSVSIKSGKFSPGNQKLDHALSSWLVQRGQPFMLFQSCGQSGRFREKGSTYDCIAGSGIDDEYVFDGTGDFSPDEFLNRNRGKWIFVQLNYDLKNSLHKRLFSNHPKSTDFPPLILFVPQKVITVSDNNYHESGDNSFSVAGQIENTETNPFDKLPHLKWENPSYENYINQFNHVMGHIHNGDVYELNLCQQWKTHVSGLNYNVLWNKLISTSPAPFACFVNYKNNWLFSASPERFIRKEGNRIFSQPMKGTSARYFNDTEVNRNLLSDNIKERAENIMITDLVRNDLSRIAKSSSVNVDELCGVYEFPKVYQMISTVSAQMRDNITFENILKATFPMGSMTGAPKIRAMELIEKYENFSRNIFSGSVGYISPDGNFDFNVIIRSLMYNSSTSELSVAAGSAITSGSNAEDEWNECNLKASALLGLFD